MSTRLDQIAAMAASAAPDALKELKAGQKKGHWVWWVFPTIAERGGDMNSAVQRARNGKPLGPTGADLADASEATEYIKHAKLRPLLLASLAAVDNAMAKHTEKAAPWAVLDKGFGRKPDGVWVGGPVDAYKLWCSATLFAAVAHQAGDAEVRAAAVSTLRHFKGDVKYTPKGEGTAGNVGGNKEQQQPTYVLTGPDQGTLDLIGAQTNTPVDWSAVLAAARQKA